MLFRKTILIISVVALSMLTGCTTRYQDMLRERDERIRELSGVVAQLRGENDELTRREAAAQASLRDASATRAPDATARGDLSALQNELGEASVAIRRGQISIGVEDSVTFDPGSTALKDSSHRILQRIVTVLRRDFANRRIYVEGHTDTDPIQKTKDKYRSNRHLSVERADAVAAYLIKQGLPESSVVVVGHGQFDPRDPKTKAKNRRVEIVVGEPL